MKQKTKMDLEKLFLMLKWAGFVFAGLAFIIGIVAFCVSEKIKKRSNEEKVSFQNTTNDFISNQVEVNTNQDELNFQILNQISELQRQVDLSKHRDSLFQIGDDRMSYEEIETYLKNQTDIANNILNRALAFYNLKQLKESEGLFKEALGMYPKNEDKKALINSYLGELYLSLPNHLHNAKKHSILAYEFYKENEKNVKEYQFELGNITNNLGRILKKETDYDGAIKYYNESVLIREKLSNDNPQKYLIDLGSIYNNIAVMFREKPEFGNAETMYLMALEIKRKAAKKNLNYLPTVATTLNNLGNYYHETQKDFEKAEGYFIEAINICQLIVDNGNKEFYLDLANYQAGFAFFLENLFIETKNPKYFKNSESWFKKVISSFSKVENKEIYWLKYSNCLHNLGRLFRVSGLIFKNTSQNDSAEKYCKEALGIREIMANSKLPEDEVNLADTQLSMALLYTYNKPNKTLALKYANLSLVNYNNNIHFKDANKWINHSRQIIDYWSKPDM